MPRGKRFLRTRAFGLIGEHFCFIPGGCGAARFFYARADASGPGAESCCGTQTVANFDRQQAGNYYSCHTFFAAFWCDKWKNQNVRDAYVILE